MINELMDLLVSQSYNENGLNELTLDGFPDKTILDTFVVRGLAKNCAGNLLQLTIAQMKFTDEPSQTSITGLILQSI